MNPKLRALLLLLTLILVLVLIGSMVLGMGGGNDAALPTPTGGAVPGRDGVRVEVLNASGIPGLARRGTEQLRAAGFDVVFYGNAPGFDPDSSLVLNRLDNLAAAESVGSAIGVPDVRSQRDTTLYLDVTVVLGRDWAEGRP
jgi:hypothetical protein